jgi:hypothetical protein
VRLIPVGEMTDSEAWQKIENMAENGYRVAFSRLESENL